MPPKVNRVNQEEILTKLGCKKVNTFNKVSFYQQNDEWQMIQPQCYYNEATQTYFFIGELRHVNYSAQTQQLMNMIQQQNAHAQHPEGCDCNEHENKEEATNDFTEDDVKTVMEQGQVDEERARQLLNEHKDVINAVLACQKK